MEARLERNDEPVPDHSGLASEDGSTSVPDRLDARGGPNRVVEEDLDRGGRRGQHRPVRRNGPEQRGVTPGLPRQSQGDERHDEESQAIGQRFKKPSPRPLQPSGFRSTTPFVDVVGVAECCAGVVPVVSPLLPYAATFESAAFRRGLGAVAERVRVTSRRASRLAPWGSGTRLPPRPPPPDLRGGEGQPSSKADTWPPRECRST